jgi:hypothetical protein
MSEENDEVEFESPDAFWLVNNHTGGRVEKKKVYKKLESLSMFEYFNAASRLHDKNKKSGDENDVTFELTDGQKMLVAKWNKVLDIEDLNEQKLTNRRFGLSEDSINDKIKEIEESGNGNI